jgi:hypothetical protein
MKTIRLTISSVLTALSYPRVWLTAYALVLVTSLLYVFPVYEVIDNSLAHHPDAGVGLDPMLDPDLARETPLRLSLTAGHVFMLITWILLGGGVLATVGIRDKFSFTGFLTEGGRLFMGNLRVVLLGIPLLVALFWGLGALDGWIRDDLLYDSDPGTMALFGLQLRVSTWEFLLGVLPILWGFAFLLVLFASKLAMARLAVSDRRSALAAWFGAFLVMVRHPIQSVLIVVLLCSIWVAVVFACGELTVLFVEAAQPAANLGLGLLTSQVGAAFTQVILVAFFLAARKLLAAHEIRGDVAAEPVVEIPRRRVVTPARVPVRK